MASGQGTASSSDCFDAPSTLIDDPQATDELRQQAYGYSPGEPSSSRISSTLSPSRDSTGAWNGSAEHRRSLRGKIRRSAVNRHGFFDAQEWPESPREQLARRASCPEVRSIFENCPSHSRSSLQTPSSQSSQASQSSQSASSVKPGALHLNVYNLPGARRVNDLARPFGLGGAFHVAIEIFGVEWTYGHVGGPRQKTGVYACAPRSSPCGKFRESVKLDSSHVHSASDIWDALYRLSGRWLGADYHPINRNCVHFCRELCKELGASEPPSWACRFVDVADVFMKPLDTFMDLPNVVSQIPAAECMTARGRVKEDSDDGSCSTDERQVTVFELEGGALKTSQKTVIEAEAMSEFEVSSAWALSVMSLHEVMSQSPDGRPPQIHQEVSQAGVTTSEASDEACALPSCRREFSRPTASDEPETLSSDPGASSSGGTGGT